jgi:hypothetical protein
MSIDGSTQATVVLVMHVIILFITLFNLFFILRIFATVRDFFKQIKTTNRTKMNDETETTPESTQEEKEEQTAVVENPEGFCPTAGTLGKGMPCVTICP